MPSERVRAPVVKVLSAQVGITGGGLDLEDAIIDGQQRHIKRAWKNREGDVVGAGSAGQRDRSCE
jgi:hypothetical protein